MWVLGEDPGWRGEGRGPRPAGLPAPWGEAAEVKGEPTGLTGEGAGNTPGEGLGEAEGTWTLAGLGLRRDGGDWRKADEVEVACGEAGVSGLLGGVSGGANLSPSSVLT